MEMSHFSRLNPSPNLNVGSCQSLPPAMWKKTKFCTIRSALSSTIAEAVTVRCKNCEVAMSLTPFGGLKTTKHPRKNPRGSGSGSSGKSELSASRPFAVTSCSIPVAGSTCWTTASASCISDCTVPHLPEDLVSLVLPASEEIVSLCPMVWRRCFFTHMAPYTSESYENWDVLLKLL